MNQDPLMTTDRNLREGRLVFYREQIALVDRVIAELLTKSGAKSAFLIDKDGHLITKGGEPGEFDPDTISALVAGAFAATKEMARLLGEREFSALFHQGERDNIQLSLVGERAILTVLFDDSTTLGMVRLYVSEAVGRLNDLFERLSHEPSGEADEGIDPTYGDDAQKTLDVFFSEDGDDATGPDDPDD